MVMLDFIQVQKYDFDNIKKFLGKSFISMSEDDYAVTGVFVTKGGNYVKFKTGDFIGKFEDDDHLLVSIAHIRQALKAKGKKVVEAIRLERNNFNEVVSFINTRYVDEYRTIATTRNRQIIRYEIIFGKTTVTIGDWLYVDRGILYGCYHSHFEDNYVSE